MRWRGSAGLVGWPRDVHRWSGEVSDRPWLQLLGKRPMGVRRAPAPSSRLCRAAPACLRKALVPWLSPEKAPAGQLPTTPNPARTFDSPDVAVSKPACVRLRIDPPIRRSLRPRLLFGNPSNSHAPRWVGACTKLFFWNGILAPCRPSDPHSRAEDQVSFYQPVMIGLDGEVVRPP